MWPSHVAESRCGTIDGPSLGADPSGLQRPLHSEPAVPFAARDASAGATYNMALSDIPHTTRDIRHAACELQKHVQRVQQVQPPSRGGADPSPA
jgi:hypothetical protein